MDKSIVSRLSNVAWAAALIDDPEWTSTNTSSRQPKASGEDSFFAETLATDRTMRACLSLRPRQAKDDHLAYWEVKTIVEIGDGLNGYPQIAHGGFVATLLDEVCGILIVLNVEEQVRRLKEQGQIDDLTTMNYFTACMSSLPYTINGRQLMHGRPEHNISQTRPHARVTSLHSPHRASAGQEGFR